MIAIVNGEARPIGAEQTIAELLAEIGVARTRRIAVEVNCNVVPSSDYERRTIRDGDRIEIVQFVGGG